MRMIRKMNNRGEVQGMPFTLIIYVTVGALILAGIVAFILLFPWTGSIEVYDEPAVAGGDLVSPSRISISEDGNNYTLIVETSGRTLLKLREFNEANNVIVEWSGATSGTDIANNGRVTIDLSEIQWRENENSQALNIQFSKADYYTLTITVLVVR